MKLAYLVNQYPTVSHTFIRREIFELERRGYEIHRVTIRKSESQLVDQLDHSEARVTHVLLETSFLLLLSSFVQFIIFRPTCFLRTLGVMFRLHRAGNRGLFPHLAYLAEAVLLAKLCSEHNIQHIHTHFGTNSAAVALLANHLAGLSYSLTVHGPEEFDAPIALSLREKVETASFVLAISHFGKGQLHRWTAPADWGKIHVVRCTVDENFFQEAQPVFPNANTLVCVGRLSAQKGQFVLLEAFSRVVAASKGVKLILAGDGELRQAMEQNIQQLALEEHVEITGWVSGSQVRRLLLNSRGLVLPSLAEGLPVVLMEAMAMGRPVVSTYVAGIPELVRDGVNGWLVPAGDVDALTEAIIKLLETPAEDLTAMGQHGIAAVRANHRLKNEVDKLEHYLKEFC